MIHPQLKKDTQRIGCFPLCSILLMNDAQYPWCILVPNRDNVEEIFQLTSDDQMQLMRESSLLGATLMQLFNGDKLNIAALGNVVPQLHVHHIIRDKGDPAWPKPIWGALPTKAYESIELSERINNIQAALAATAIDFSASSLG